MFATKLRSGAQRAIVVVVIGACALSFGRVHAQVVTFQNFTEAKAAANVTSITLSTPSGTVQGDLLIACVVTDGTNSTTLNPPAGQGWNLISRNVQGTAVTLGVWWKLAGASEPSTHQWTWSALEQSYAWMMRFTGHSPTAPINTSAATGGTSSAPTTPAVSPTVTDTLILRIGGFDDDDITLDSPGLTLNGPHTAVTMDESGTGTQSCSGGAGYRTQAATGTSGTSNFALTVSRAFRTATVAIAPFRCVNAGECDDANVCTTDTCVSGFCQHTNNTAACNDGNACTVSDVCAGGSCQPGAPPNCSGAGNQCNTASCNPSGSTGNCDTLTPVTNNTPCSDGLFCTDGDACVGGTCASGGALDCSSFGNQCNTGVCDEALDQCVAQPANEGQICTDGNNCTLNETCQSGTCTGGAPPNCTGADNPCNIASCNPAGALGNCDTLTPRTNGTPCNDGAFCTATDTCQSGVCVGAGDPCPGDICDEFLNVCLECAVHTDCDDGVACTIDVCNSGSCQHAPNNALCSDGLFCNGAETCNATLGCEAGAPPCTDGIACTVDTCDEGTDSCTYTPNNVLCDDGSFCNGAEICSAVLGCQPGTSPCVDGIACTVDSCDEGTDVCTFTPNNAACDDGAFCNGSESCSGTLGCQPGTDPCIDAIACTVDACVESTDTCTYTPNHAACDDGAFCNGPETCNATLGCQSGANPCVDAFPCTSDACVESTDTCTFTPNDAVCDNGLYCDGMETCDPLLGCLAGVDPCLVTQVCVEATDICQECLDAGDCDDANPCTTDSCLGGACSHAPAGDITVNLEVEGLGGAVTRDVSFEITSCGNSPDARVGAIAFSALGTATVLLSNVDANSDWIAVREGHTLRKRAPLTFAVCSATANLTGVEQVRSGDFAAGAIAQDNLVDITDFSILASRWNQPVDPNLATGADATGDGLQSTGDFTAIQANFLRTGDPSDGCTVAASRQTVRANDSPMRDLEARSVDARMLRVPVRSLRLPDAHRADSNNDGYVDLRDIRDFAHKHRLPLFPEFESRLREWDRTREK